MEAMLPRRFSIFAGSNSTNSRQGTGRELPSPTLICRVDREVYRPGDEVLITIEIHCPNVDSSINGAVCSFLIKKLSFEIKGMEKLDSQWFATQKPLPESRQRRGEFFFMDSSAPSIASNLIVSSGTTKTYLVRAELPRTLPPSYKGATIRYLYYVKSMLSGQWQIFDKTYGQSGSKDLTEMQGKFADNLRYYTHLVINGRHIHHLNASILQEARIPLHVWTGQGNSGLLSEEGQVDGIVPATTIQLDTYWKEVDGESDWVRANDVYDGVEEGYDSSKDETSSVSSYNPNKESLLRSFGSSLSLHSTTARSSSRDLLYVEGNRTSLSVNVPPPQLSVAESVSDNNGDTSPQKSPVVSPSQRQRLSKSSSLENDEAAVPPIAAREGFVRGRSYNIRLDEQVLLRFSPKNSESTYYFSDMIGGTLTFFHEGAARRCLEVLVTLETSETINRQFLHPSRRNSPTITKVQSEHHEVVADLVQTSFLFSIPTDGPMSFSTPRISVKWCLRFEFYTTPKNVDWTRYDHPLLVEGRDKNEWVLPITVHAPPSGNLGGQSRNKKPLSVEPPWGRT